MHASIKGVREDMSSWSKKLDERNQKIKDLENDRRRLKEQLRRESEKVDKGSAEELRAAREQNERLERKILELKAAA